MTAKRLINANDAVSFLENSLSIIKEMDINGNMKESIKWYEEFIKFIKNRPTVDAVEVVRCKDCTYCDVYQKEANISTLLVCMIHLFEVVDPDGFCSCGERKDYGKQ